MTSSTARRVVRALGFALVVAGCTGGQPAGSSPAPAASGGPATSAVTTLVPDTPVPSAGAATPAPSGPPAITDAHPGGTTPPQPPAARIGADGEAWVEGELGSYTWQGGGSDAPWIVVPARDAARFDGPYRIELDPPLEPVAWAAVWAPVERGTRGSVAGHEQGSGGQITLEGPQRPGVWSLRLDLDFGSVGRATWYWRLAPAR